MYQPVTNKIDLMQLLMLNTPWRGVILGALAGVVSGVVMAQQEQTRDQPRQVITPAAYDGWNTLSGGALSADGRWASYTITDEAGRSELVIRRTTDSTAYRIPGGAVAGSGFSADNRFFLCGVAAPDTGQPGLALLSLATGRLTTLSGVSAFTLTPHARAAVIYQRHGESALGTSLVLRMLATGEEHVIADHVTAYKMDPRGAWLVYAVSPPDRSRDGVYLRSLTKSLQLGSETSLVAEPGRYTGFAFDSAGTRLAFLGAQPASASRSSLYAVSLTAGATARQVVSADSLGDTLQIAANLPPRFTGAGNALVFGVTPVRRRLATARSAAPTDSAGTAARVELWHYRDPFLPPRRRRSNGDPFPSTAIYWPDTDRWVRLGTDLIPYVTLSDNASLGLAVTGVPYAIEGMWGRRRHDVYTVDTRTGRHTLLRRGMIGPFGAPYPGQPESPDERVVLSSTGKYVLLFEDGRWRAHDVATGRTVDLTGSVKSVRFDDETYDEPSPPRPWGVAGWLPGDAGVLIYDRFDIWAFDPAGVARPRNVTGGIGRQRHLVFRRPDASRWSMLDPAHPLLLSAENLETRETGFWRVRLDRDVPPTRLTMVPARLTLVAKAAAAGRYLITRESYREYPDLWVTDRLDSLSYSRLTDVQPQGRRYRWGTAELMPFTSSTGQRLSAVLHKPEDFDSTRKYPLLVSIYERQSQQLHNYQVPQPNRGLITPVTYVSQGYLVLRPDIAYTVGRTCESAVASVVAAVRTLIARGYVDSTRIGVLGHSFGAYETVCLLTRTQLFRAAIASNGPMNLTSVYGTFLGDANSFAEWTESRQGRMGVPPWEDPARYIENSPVFHVQHIRTPLLTMHNDGDNLVRWEEGLQLFTAMRRLGKEMYLFNYSGESHGLDRRANALDWDRRTREFFDYYLMDGPRPRWMDLDAPAQRVSPQTSAAKLDGFVLNNKAWHLFKTSTDPEELQAAIAWMERVLQQPEDAVIAANLDTYANLLYKVGRVAEAIAWEERARKLAGEANSPDEAAGYQAVLDKMKEGVPTWPQP